LSGFARLVNLYVTLSPYTKAVLSDSFSKGYPVQRPLFFEYEDDPISYEQQYQYLLGPDLLVAPVLQKDAVKKNPLYIMILLLC
jgi:alpha-glucosidase